MRALSGTSQHITNRYSASWRQDTHHIVKTPPNPLDLYYLRCLSSYSENLQTPTPSNKMAIFISSDDFVFETEESLLDLLPCHSTRMSALFPAASNCGEIIEQEEESAALARSPLIRRPLDPGSRSSSAGFQSLRTTHGTTNIMHRSLTF